MMKKTLKRVLCSILTLMMVSAPMTAAVQGEEQNERVLGDLNWDSSVDISDALLLFMNSMIPGEYPIENYPGILDFDLSGTVDIGDALRLFMHGMIPAEYPIDWKKEAEEFTMIDPKTAFDAEEVKLNFRKQWTYASPLNPNYEEGSETTYTSWNTAEISLDGCYGLYYNLAAHKLIMSVAFFDAEGKYISGVYTESMNNYATSVTGFVVCPENAVKASVLGFSGTEVIPKFEESLLLRFDSAEAFNAAKGMYRFDGLKIACLGDSLTEGDYGPITSYGGRRFQNYPYYLAHLTGAEVTNYGRCGASASSYYADHYKVGDIDISDSDVILVMLGTNQGLAGMMRKQYKTLIQTLLEDKKPGAKLILITPPSATTDSNKINYGYYDNVLSANASVIALAKEKGLIYFDALKDSPIQPEVEDQYQDFDGLHMNAAGYLAFAEYIAAELSCYID